MNSIWANIVNGIIETSHLEWIAVLTGVLYVVLAAKKSIFCWLFALVSAAIYMYLCYTSQLLLESFLQLFYVLMAIVGWYYWNKTKDQEEWITTWRIDVHFFNIGISTVIVVVVGYYFENNTNQAYPYLDAFTTVFSLAATYMVTQRVLENWIYWIVIDIAGVFLYAAKDFYLTALLYSVFTFLAVYGFFQWRNKLKMQEG